MVTGVQQVTGDDAAPYSLVARAVDGARAAGRWLSTSLLSAWSATSLTAESVTTTAEPATTSMTSPRSQQQQHLSIHAHDLPMALATATLATALIALLLSRRLRRAAKFWARLTANLGVVLVTCLCGLVTTAWCVARGRRELSNYYNGRIYSTLAHYTLGIRYRITGDPSALDIAQTGPYVAICNHQSSLDVLSMAALWPRQKLAVIAKESLKMVPVFGTALWAAGNVFIRRTDRDKAIEALRDAALEIRRRHISIFLFPEGTRNRSAKNDLLPFKKGAFHMALAAGVPIVPIVISTYGPIYSYRRRLFESGVITVKVLPPVDTSTYSTETIDLLINDCRQRMLHALAEIESVPDDPTVIQMVGSDSCEWSSSSASASTASSPVRSVADESEERKMQ